MLSFVGICARTKTAVASTQFVSLSALVVPHRFYATKPNAKPLPPAAKGTKVKGTTITKPPISQGTAIKGSPVTAKPVTKKPTQEDATKTKEKQLQAKLAQAKAKEKKAAAASKAKAKSKDKDKGKDKLKVQATKEKERDKAAKQKEKEAQAKQKEKEREKSAKEKEKQAQDKQKEKDRLAKEKEKKAQTNQKEKERSKALQKKEREKAQAAKTKEKEKLAKMKESNKAARTKEHEKLAKEKQERAKARAEKAARPKRALSSYMFFCNDTRASVMKAHPNKKITEIGKEIANRWKALSAAEKKKYEDMAQKDKIRNQKEAVEYKKTHPDPPKKPISPYLAFVKDVYKKMREEHSDLAPTQLLKPIAEKWAGMSADQKKPYEKQSLASKEKYEKDLKAFERTHPAKATAAAK